MKIYTKTGDDGTTGLFGGDRVDKDHLRIEAYGTVDELNAVVGLVRVGLNTSTLAAQNRFTEIDSALARIQDELFVLGADLATPSEAKPSVPRVSDSMTTTLEREIDRFSEILPELKSFVLPGGSEVASRLHLARTVCRRAERLVVQAARELPDQPELPESSESSESPKSQIAPGSPDLPASSFNPEIVRYLNRLSDHLFVLARLANQLEGVKAPEWHPAKDA